MMPEALNNALQSAADAFPFLLQGTVYTVELSLGAMALGSILGLAVALMRLSPRRPLAWAARAYVSALRGTPLLAQLFIIYYGLPEFGIELEPMTCALLGFSLNTAAYTSETMRAAILSIDGGQWEAAASLGMTRWQILRRAILPQAVRVALPSLGNSFISLVKDTSLAATIQVPELFRQAQLITARTFDVFTMYLSASLVYWVLAASLSLVQHRLERRVGRYVRVR
jgi:cystine transport system permease protein